MYILVHFYALKKSGLPAPLCETAQNTSSVNAALIPNIRPKHYACNILPQSLPKLSSYWAASWLVRSWLVYPVTLLGTAFIGGQPSPPGPCLFLCSGSVHRPSCSGRELLWCTHILADTDPLQEIVQQIGFWKPSGSSSCTWEVQSAPSCLVPITTHCGMPYRQY